MSRDQIMLGLLRIILEHHFREAERSDPEWTQALRELTVRQPTLEHVWRTSHQLAGDQ